MVESRLAEWRACQPCQWRAPRLAATLTASSRSSAIGSNRPRVAPGDALDLTTYWRVTGELAPLAFFAHVIDAGQRIVGQYDGWGTAMRGLEIGDVIVQHVSVPIKPDASPGSYSLQLGVYLPDTMTRWPLRLPSGDLADRVLLSSITVR